MFQDLSSSLSLVHATATLGFSTSVALLVWLFAPLLESCLLRLLCAIRSWLQRRAAEVRSPLPPASNPSVFGSPVVRPRFFHLMAMGYRFGPWLSRWTRPNPRMLSELRALGHDDALDEGSFLMVRLAFAAMGLLVALLLLLLAKGAAIDLSALQSWCVCLGAMAVGAVHPASVVRTENKRLRGAVARAFPSFLDGLALALESGQAFAPAFAQAAERMAEGQGPWVQHLLRAASELRAGRDRAEVLARLEGVLGERSVQQFVAASITAERAGIGLAPIFRDQAALARTLLHHEVERLAMQAPVKLLGPLMVCIFPCTFLVLLSPLVAQLQASLLGGGT